MEDKLRHYRKKGIVLYLVEALLVCDIWKKLTAKLKSPAILAPKWVRNPDGIAH